jgi:serine/threonine protein kinase
MTSHVLSPGVVFAGRYKVLRCIGSGGMGAVYEGEHVETERKVALKVLLAQALATEGTRERFKQEARVAGRLRHPNIVEVLDAGVDDASGMPYLVMELLEGETLGSRMEWCGPLPAEEALLLLHQAASALDRLHERSIVHRDLKPENLFLTWSEDGTPTVKLLDFGIAKVIAEGMTSAYTQDAQGTPVYMAPEQFAEQIRISPATDVYGLGMLAFALLTGKHYWGPEVERGMNVFMLARIAEGGPKEPASERARTAGVDLPRAFDGWFAIITARAPGERFATATVAIEELAEALGVPLPVGPFPLRRRDTPAPRSAPPADTTSSPVGSTPPIPLQKPYSFWKRPTAMTVALLVVAAAVAATMVFTLAKGSRPDASLGAGATVATSPAASLARPSATVPQAASVPPATASAVPSATPVDPPATAAPPATTAALSTPGLPGSRSLPVSSSAPPGSTKHPRYTRD